VIALITRNMDVELKVLNVVGYLSPFVKDQFVALEKFGVKGEVINIPGQIIPERPRSPLNYFKAYLKVFKKSFSEYDLIHAQYGLTAPLSIAQFRLPVVLTLWGSDLLGQYGKLSRVCARWCDEVIVRSEEMQQKLGRHCHIIPCGVNLELFKPMKREKAITQIGWDPCKKHILFPYDPYRPVKNYQFVKKVMEILNNEINVELHEVYDVPHNKMPIYFNASDLLIVASLREGSPNTVKEAMACNRPILASNVGDVKKIVDNTKGCTVLDNWNENDYADKILESLMIGSTTGRERIIKLGLDWNDIAKKIYNIYIDIL